MSIRAGRIEAVLGRRCVEEKSCEGVCRCVLACGVTVQARVPSACLVTCTSRKEIVLFCSCAMVNWMCGCSLVR